ncbi:MAG: (E)-4-hydroxy-3-methylbut-2-enyl-diphosphate synthase [Bacteroidales bacterium]|nr:(E)-4-hydroxy-3-methylbut-2-enyl-diphosphate synthase [Bacteroidales bacterium]
MGRYCIDLTNYERFPTREIKIGNTPMGAMHPIRLQSMTNVSAQNVKATILQCKEIFDAGADYVRIATPSIKEAESLKDIKKQLSESGYNKPLIADVHFNPVIAETAARIVEKVRINPGNYVDKRASFKKTHFTESEYKQELEKIRIGLEPLVKICKQYGTVLRIGSNHGSLSDRIMSSYGNTAEGMVEAAMEYLRIFVDLSFFNIVVSMKASNVKIMVKSSRLLNSKMLENGWNFPQHLGVTEAGEGEDGRIRSALGIGSLLQDGIGDTIRVSLTENPVAEIKFAKKIVQSFLNRKSKIQIIPNINSGFNPYLIQTKNDCSFLPGEKISIISDSNNNNKLSNDLHFSLKADEFCKNTIIPFKEWKNKKLSQDCIPLITAEEIINHDLIYNLDKAIIKLSINDFGKIKKLIASKINHIAFVLETVTDFPIGEIRTLYNNVVKQFPNAVCLSYVSTESIDTENQIVEICLYPVAAMIDNLIDGVWLKSKLKSEDSIYTILANLLQACGYRRNKAEFVSCPGCGRTNFDLETAVRRVKHKLSHLKNLKIAVMGCIVNGPGEMADADYGYVGAGHGKIHIYKGQKAIKKNISEGEALSELIELIKKHGDWQEPK